MKQNLKSALIAALVAAVVAAPASYAAGESAVNQRQDIQIHDLQNHVRILQDDVNYAYTSMNQLQCEIEHPNTWQTTRVCG